MTNLSHFSFISQAAARPQSDVCVLNRFNFYSFFLNTLNYFSDLVCTLIQGRLIVKKL